MRRRLTKLAALHGYDRNARVHSRKQMQQIADSIREFGFVNPILVDARGRVIAGHGRVARRQAARHGARCRPIRLEHLTPEQMRAYASPTTAWPRWPAGTMSCCALELQELSELDLDFDLEITGFETGEIDLLIAGGRRRPTPIPPMTSPEPAATAVAQPGDLWLLGQHRLLCGDARDAGAYAGCSGDDAHSWSSPIRPTTCRSTATSAGSGKIRHREFAMASGEMTEAEFTGFLASVLGDMAAVTRRRRHPLRLHGLAAHARAAGGRAARLQRAQEPLRLGQDQRRHGLASTARSTSWSSCSRSATAPHINNVELGRARALPHQRLGLRRRQHLRRGRDEELAMHPTVKPVALVADAIHDCSQPRRHRARSLRRQRHDPDRRRADRPARLACSRSTRSTST